MATFFIQEGTDLSHNSLFNANKNIIEIIVRTDKIVLDDVVIEGYSRNSDKTIYLGLAADDFSKIKKIEYDLDNYMSENFRFYPEMKVSLPEETFIVTSKYVMSEKAELSLVQEPLTLLTDPLIATLSASKNIIIPSGTRIYQKNSILPIVLDSKLELRIEGFYVRKCPPMAKKEVVAVMSFVFAILFLAVLFLFEAKK